jgi:hypothetical protein
MGTLIVEEIIDGLSLRNYSGDVGTDRIVKGGYSSDLLSDVMGNAKVGQAWITLQTHRNVAAIASLKDLSAIILVKNSAPDPDMLEHAIKEGVPVLGTADNTFEVSAKLFNLLTK